MGVFVWIWLMLAQHSGQERNDGTLILFWNLENFFDYREGDGGRRWTSRKFYAKCNAVAKALFWIGDRYGRMPDAVGVAEVGNAFVLRRLLQSTLLRKLDYGIVHRESPDRRGIDVALLYRKSRFDTLSVTLRKLYGPDGAVLPTRGILCVTLRDRVQKDTLQVFVNHHPSKYGGTAVSEPRRRLAVSTLRHLADSLGGKRVAMGDFNDTPANPVFKQLEGPLTSKADSLFKAGRGSIRYEGKWELIDLFFVSPEIRCRMDVVEVPFLQTKDSPNAGTKPFRTYSGPRYIGGVSDHLPVILEIY